MIKQENDNVVRMQKANIPDGTATLNLNEIELEKYLNFKIYEDLEWLEKFLKTNLKTEDVSIELIDIDEASNQKVRPIQMSYMTRVKVRINGVEGFLFGIPDLQRGLFLINKKPKIFRNIIDRGIGLYTTSDGEYQLKTEQSSLTFEFVPSFNTFMFIGKKKSKVSPVDILVSMLNQKGRYKNGSSYKDIQESVYDYFESPYIRSCLYGKDKILETYTSQAARNVYGNIQDHNISVKARKRLATKISFERFIGETLISGEIITKEFINSLGNSTNRLTIKHKADLTDFFLSEEITVKSVKKGQLITTILREHLKKSGYSPEIYECGYSPEDIEFKEGKELVLAKDTLITFDENELIKSLDLESIKIRRLNREPSFTYRFRKEIYRFPNNNRTNLDLDDFLAVVSYITGIREYPEKYIIYNRDDNFEKDILTFSGMYSKYFRKAVKETFNDPTTSCKDHFVKLINDNVNTYYDLSKIIMKKLKILLGPAGDNLIQHCEAVCPVDLLSSINGIIPSHLNSTAGSSKKERGFSPNTIGVVDPLDTPQGARLGLVEQLTIYAKTIDEDVEIPMRKITNGYLSPEVEMLSLDYLADKTYTTIDELEFENPFDPFNSKITTKWCHAIAPAHSVEDSTELVAIYSPIENVNYALAYYDSICSVATSLIPMLGNVDGARGTFGAAMVKQTVPLVKPEKPKVYTPMYKQIGEALQLSRYSPVDGEVIIINSFFIRIRSTDGEIYNIDLKNRLPKSQVTLNYDILVVEGQEVKKGDIVAQSKFTKDGMYAPGRNVFVAYMPLYGNNYDDSIAIRRGCAYDFRSISINYVEKEFEATSRAKLERPVYLGKYVGEGDTIGTVIINNTKKYDLKSSTAKCGRVNKVYKDVVDQDTHKMSVELVDTASMISGDKAAGFFGNKGTVSAVYEDYEMPRFKNGVIIDIAQNSHGVPSRMNPGQISVGHLGFCAYLLDIEIVTQPYGGASHDEIYELLEYLYYVANKMDTEANQMSSIPDFIKVRANERKNEIIKWKGCFDKSGNAILVDPVSGEEFVTPITFGYTYYLKLMHQVDHKINVRGFVNEKYLASTKLPTKSLGKQGGQTIGEMELEALLAHGVSHYIQELLHLKSGNINMRENFVIDYQNNFVNSENIELLKEDLKNPRIQSQILGYYIDAMGLGVECSEESTIFGETNLDPVDASDKSKKDDFIESILGTL